MRVLDPCSPSDFNCPLAYTAAYFCCRTMASHRRRSCLIEPLEFRTFLSAAELIRIGVCEVMVSSSDCVRGGNFQADSRLSNFPSGAGYAYLANTDGSSGNSLS